MQIGTNKVSAGSTWHYEVDRCSRIPAEAHRIAKHLLWFHWSETEILSGVPAVASQSVDVM